MKFLALTLIIAISGAGFADQTDDIDNRKKRLKKGFMLGGAVVGGIVDWRVFRHVDHKLFEIAIDLTEKTSRRSRMSLSRFTKIDITDPPIYRLTAPDGSQHHILGTMHTSSLSLSDFSKNSQLMPIVEQANILMPEFAGTGLTSVLKFQFYDQVKWQWQRQFVEQLKLSEQLGEQRWQRLTQMIAEKPDLKPFEQSLAKFMANIDGLTVDEAYHQLINYADGYATPIEGLKMDFQLIRYGREYGKTLIGLETFKQGRVALMKTLAASNVEIADLRSLIDKGAIDYVAETMMDSVRHYADGNLYESYKLLENITPPGARNAIDHFLLDQRNIAWVESGKIQENCVHGNKCLIFVGFGHLIKGNNTLIKLLKEQGYRIERI